MAVTRAKKNTLVAKLAELFTDSKCTVGATYTGLTVANLQELRALARANNVVIKVSKNRLIRVALSQVEKFKGTDTSLLTGQLVYAFSSEDEVAPAQILAKFAKTHPEVKLVAGFNEAGVALDTATVNALAQLPTKDQLRGQLVGVLAAPLRGFLTVAGGTQSGFVRVLSERAKAL